MGIVSATMLTYRCKDFGCFGSQVSHHANPRVPNVVPNDNELREHEADMV